MVVTWDTVNRSLYTTLSGGNLAVTGSIQRTVAVAVDIPNKLVWFRNGQTLEWNASATANPATGTGGIAFTPATGLFPMASGDPGTANDTTISLNGGSSTFAFAAVPSGFTAWDTLAGSATTWNPSDKNAAVTLSSGNAIASFGSAGAYTAVRGTNSLSSGKAYFEFTALTWGASSFWVAGLGQSGASLSNYVGSTGSVSFGVQNQGSIQGATGSGDSSAYTTASTFYSGVLATQSRSSGKYYFEVTVAALETGSGFHLGLGDGNVVNFGNFSGSTTHGFSFNVMAGGNNVYYNNSSSLSADFVSHAGKTVGAAVDFGAKLIWFWCNDGVNRWNASGTANPATGTGGFSISSLLGVSATQFPIITPHAHDSSLSAIANFGATSFVNTLPTGFSSWDGSQVPLSPVDLVGNLGGSFQYGKLAYGKGQYSRISAFAPIFAGDLNIVPVVNFAGGLTPTIVLAADLDVHVNLIDFAGGLAPQIALGGSLSLDLLLTVLEGGLTPIVSLGASSFVSGPLWAVEEPVAPPWAPSEPCPPPPWMTTAPCDPVVWSKSRICNG